LFYKTAETNAPPLVREPIPDDCSGTISVWHKNKEITVPKIDRAQIPEKRAWRLAKRAVKKRQPITGRGHQGSHHARIVHWPYWVGIVQTEKKRPLFGLRRITYYAISDAVIGGSTVARTFPELETQSVPMDLLIPSRRKMKDFEQELVAIKRETIPKLFIFGPPKQKLEGIQLIYCPFWEIIFACQSNGGSELTVYVNALNGAVREFGRE